ncbi:MAG: glutamine synthetase type III [Lentisphaerae bacterium]|nr:glutamine synthetase type III [Lentisphaerota bacterium]
MDTCDKSRLVPSLFGSWVFNDTVMRERLPKNVYRALQDAIRDGRPLDSGLADILASAMKDWAIEKGATHYCHWFQPMTGVTAEKHDAFISPTPQGTVIMEFSGRELSQGEPDASSFPSGGLRATFEARGYTAWDCTSPVFIKKDGANTTLFIPSFFCSYHGQALDKKTPLLRSMEALNRQALRVLRALGNEQARRVSVTLGAEQEYFLIDRRLAARRPDLLFCGRTLFGAPAPKGQEMDDHYFGSLHERVASYMSEVNQQLWLLGVTAKTQHNEVAPSQYEIAPIFEVVNVGVDHNQLVMETLQKVARRHDFICLLHEKPFAGVNGSGKHNNWSMVTDDGVNLLAPGDTPHENLQFLVFLFAVLRGVDRYADMLRASVAHAGNDHRLGANEAPPAIISVFLGEQLTEIIEQIEKGHTRSSKACSSLQLGVSTLPPLPKDSTDRNRTSPFAFTGNKFEFRMPGSSQSLSGPNVVLNTAVAESLREIADELERPGTQDRNVRLQKLLREYAREHRRVIFNGDGYTAAWKAEAARRGLPNLASTMEALEAMATPKNQALFERHGVFSATEYPSRQEIMVESYAKSVLIEGKTALHMVRRQILPAVMAAAGEQARTVSALEAYGVPGPARELLQAMTAGIEAMGKALEGLEAAMAKARAAEGSVERGRRCRDDIRPALVALREVVDALEARMPSGQWPLPTYAEMLYEL